MCKACEEGIDPPKWEFERKKQMYPDLWDKSYNEALGKCKQIAEALGHCEQSAHRHAEFCAWMMCMDAWNKEIKQKYYKANG